MSKEKKKLYQACLDVVNQRVENAKVAIKAAQDAANDDSKSSSTDEGDAELALRQMDVENHSKSLGEAMKLKEQLKAINPEKVNDTVIAGAMVETNNGKFYIAIPAGKLPGDFFGISLSSPIGQALRGLKKGQSANFNGKKYTISKLS